jgi:hypothetical protein
MLEINKPYVYRIKNKTTGQFYYGSKYSKVCCYTTFWKDYFTSSATIRKLIKLYGKDDWDIKILKTYQTAREALLNEQKYIKRCFKSKYSLNLRYFEYNGESLDDLDTIEKMVMTRKIPDENGKTSYLIGGRKTADTKKSIIMPDGRSLMQVTVDKTAQIRHNRGDYKKLSKEMTGVGKGICPERKICVYCDANTNLGNYFRWHGENCKKNPNITEEQLKKREPWNKTKEDGTTRKVSDATRLKNKLAQQKLVSAFDVQTLKFVRINKDIFNEFKHIRYYGTTHSKVKEILKLKEINE